MARFCTNCGSPMDDSAKFCTKCGAVSTPGQQPQASPPPPQSQAPPSYQGQPQYQAPAAGTGMQQNVAGLLCYILGLITGIIFLVLEPYNKNPFVRFHAFQSIFFHVVWIGLYIVYRIIVFALPWSLQILGSLLYLVIALGGFLLWLFLMYKAYNNEQFKLPVIGDLVMKQAG